MNNPFSKVIFNGASLVIKVPHIKNEMEVKTVVLSREHIAKVLISFHKALQVIFFYTAPEFGRKVRELLGMQQGDDLYFDPLSKDESYKRITLLPETFLDDTKIYIKQLYGKPFSIIDELSVKEANNILMKTCIKDVSKTVVQQNRYDCNNYLLLCYINFFFCIQLFRCKAVADLSSWSRWYTDKY